MKWERLLWYPHEHLWNWDLFRAIERLLPFRPAYRAIQVGIIAADTAILFWPICGRRCLFRGADGYRSQGVVPEEACIFYSTWAPDNKADESPVHRAAAAASAQVSRPSPSKPIRASWSRLKEDSLPTRLPS